MRYSYASILAAGHAITRLWIADSMHDFLVAFALLLIFEGIWPFLNPASFQRALAAIATEPAAALRLGGLLTMASGLVLLYLVN